MTDKTKDELERMTMKQLREYAKEVGCCLGYDGARKETAVRAILSFQYYHNLEGGE